MHRVEIRALGVDGDPQGGICHEFGVILGHLGDLAKVHPFGERGLTITDMDDNVLLHIGPRIPNSDDK